MNKSGVNFFTQTVSSFIDMQYPKNIACTCSDKDSFITQKNKEPLSRSLDQNIQDNIKQAKRQGHQWWNF